MIVEWSAKTLRPAAFDDYVDHHSERGYAIAARHLPLVGALASASGTKNQIVHIAAFDDYDQREQSLSSLGSDPEWRAFRRGPEVDVIAELATILNPTGFSAIRGYADFTAAAGAARARRPMLFELRTYTAIPGKMPIVLQTLVDEGNPLTHQFVEWPVAYFTAETGLSNRVMMLWAYSSAGERARRKARMLPDPRFKELGSRFNPNFSEQRSDFFVPMAFSPLR